MKLVKPSWEILEQNPGLEGIYEAIERAGRTCYKSTRPEGKTAKDFIDMLIKMGHGAMLEHGTVYLKIPSKFDAKFDKYYYNPYSIAIDGSDLILKGIKTKDTRYYYITTNYRVLVENNWLDDLKYLCEPTEFHEKRVTVKFITSIGIGREFLRHRVFSFANESTRYCNYSSEKKFGGEVTFIIPSWLDIPEGKISLRDAILGDLVAVRTYVDTDGLPTTEWRQEPDIKPGGYYSDEEPISDDWKNEKWLFIRFLEHAENYYFTMLNKGWKPQQAREVLPLATKSELIMTGFISDWKDLFNKRTSIIAATGKPHPDMSNLCDPLYKEFIERNYIE